MKAIATIAHGFTHVAVALASKSRAGLQVAPAASYDVGLFCGFQSE